MRLVVQRVRSAAVRVAGEEVGTIGRGLMVLVGIETTDSKKEMDYCISKMMNAKLWDEKDEGEAEGLSSGVRVRNCQGGNPGKSWARSVMDRGFEVLLVSQFTLFGSLKKGNKPDFHWAMKNTSSKPFFSEFVEAAKAFYKPEKIQVGSFGSYMEIDMVGDGPVTIIIEKENPNKATLHLQMLSQTVPATNSSTTSADPSSAPTETN